MMKFDSCEYTYFEDLALDQNKTLVKRISFEELWKRFILLG
jgi:hypothetical protein